MADLEQQYQDPYERRILQQYNGDPRERRESPSLGKFALTFAKNAVMFGLAMKGVDVLGKFMSSAGTQVLKRLPRIGGQTVSQLFKNLQPKQNSLTNELISKHFSSVGVYSNWKKHWDTQRQLIKTNRVGPYFSTYKNLDKITNTYTKYNKNKLVDFWKPENRLARLSGKTFVTGQKYMKTATSWYVANKFLNVINTSDEGGPRPAWYDLPAHIGDFVKFTAYTIPTIAAFNLIGPVIGMGREFASNVVAKGVNVTGAKMWLPGGLNKISKHIPKIKGVTKGTGAFYNALRGFGVVGLAREPLKAMKYAQKQFYSTMKNYLDNAEIPQTSQLNYALLQLKKANPTDIKEKGLRPSEYSRFLTKWVKGRSKKPIPAWQERIMDFRRPVLSGDELDKLVSGFRPQDQAHVKPVLESLQRKGVPLYDRGVYKGGVGTSKNIDLRNLDPTRIRNNFLEFMNQQLKLPFTKIPILPIFHVDRVLRNQPIIKYLRPNEKHVVGISDYTPMGDYQVGSQGGIFSSGQFWHIGKVVGDRSKYHGYSKMYRMTPSAVQFKLVTTGKRSVEREVMRNYVGLSTQAQKTNDHLAKKLGPLGKLIYKVLDLTKVFSPTSVPGKIKGVVDKYVQRDSPLRLHGIAEDAMSSHEGESTRQAYLDTMRLVLGRAKSHAADIFRNNPRVLQGLGVDTTMSDPQLRSAVEVAQNNLGMTAHGKRLLRWYRVEELMSKTEGDMDFRDWYGHFKKSASGASLSGKQELLEFLAADKLIKNRNMVGMSDAINEHVARLTYSKTINESQASTLRIWGKRFGIENAIADRRGNVDAETVTRISSLMKDNKRDIDTVIKTSFKPITTLIRPDESRELEDLTNRLLGNQKEIFNGFMPLPNSGKTIKFMAPPAEFMEVLKDKNSMIDVGAGNVLGNVLGRRLERLFDFMGFGLDLTKYKTGSSLLFKGILGRRALPIAGGIFAAQVADQVVDMNPMFDGTMFDEGLGVAAAEQGVKARMMLASTYDFLGVTSAAKYAEGLMPGFIDSPLMRAMRGAVGPVMLGGLVGGSMTSHVAGPGFGMLAGVGLGALQGFGAFDLTKSREELEEVYSGREEVPVRRGRWWMLSAGNFQGGRVHYFRPNWFARLKSKYKDSPDGLGSPIEQLLYKPLPFLGFNPIGQIFDPHHYAYRHYYSQPYPETGVPFDEVPIIGPSMAATVGRLISPPHQMHRDELKMALGLEGYAPFARNMPGGGLAAGDESPFRSGTSRYKMQFPVSSTDVTQAFDEQLYNATEAAGLWGFGAETMTERMFGFKQPFEGQQIMANSNEMTSMRRAYWDLNLGDPIGATELWRRFLPRPRQHLNVFNPLVNTMPSWMPDNFHIGNPYAQIPEGELLLPGTGYEASHDVDMTYPVHAEMLGLELEDTVRAMLGTHPQNYSKYAHRGSDIDRKNREVLASSTIYDPYHNISGMHDGIVRLGRTRGVQKIKNLSENELNSFIGPANSDISELNFYMRRLGMDMGTLSYQFNGQPILNHAVKYSEARYLRDIATVRQARYDAKDLQDRGLGFGGESYSHIDRLSILANVAPYSDEYKQEEKIVKMQMKAGYPHMDRLSNIKRKKDAIMRKQDFFPYRFAGKVMTPDSEYNNQSFNENIKAADQYTPTERMIGSLWERASHMNTPIHSKFMNYRSPREAYERSTLYGRDIKMWSHPIDHFASAYARGFMSKTTPFAGSIAGAWAGHIIGGPGLGTAIGAGMGAVYGGVHGVYRSITGSTYIPGVIKEQRKMGRYFDQVSYAKNMMLYNATGDRNFLEEAEGTMAGLIPGDTSRNGWSHMYRATPPAERPFIMSFIRETDNEERGRILDLVPEDIGEVLKSKWAKVDGGIYNDKISRGITQPLPTPDWAGWAPEVPLEDVKVKVIEQEGMDAHDFGLGWYDQMNRINESPWLSNISADMGNTTRATNMTYNQNISEMRRTIEMTLSRLGIQATITVTPGAQNNITIVSI